MNALAGRLTSRLRQLIERHRLPWHVVNVGARSELCFAPEPARTARESLDACVPALERALHLFLLNRGVLITPFHNMMLVSPATTVAQVDHLLAGIESFLAELLP
jgi:glutamate-1-semialdehyde 2,1-aminomutase